MRRGIACGARLGAVTALASAAALSGCASTGQEIAVYQPAVGSNQVLSGPIAAAPGHSLVVGDLVMEAGGTIPRHYHVGEEFLYVLGGSAIVSRQGEPDVTLAPGQGLRIAPGTVHWGKAGPQGVRAVSSWVATDGQPLRVAVPE
jgi:quercetin dioxygenase-like cupin family protein